MTPRRKRVTGILFDIDGTLIDSNDIHARAWVEAFAEFGKHIAFKLMRSQIGKGGDLLVPDLLSAREMQEFGEKVKKRRASIFKAKYMHQIRPFKRVKENLETLRARGIRMALASSANPHEVDYYIELMEIGELIETSTSTEDAKFSKPSPEIFEAALLKLGTSKRQTLVVGDTPWDILAAHRCALPIAAVRSGGFERSTLTKAEFIFSSVATLVERIDQIDDYFNR